MIEFLQNKDVFSWEIITILISIGFIVGFINTLAGSGSVLNLSLFDMLGLPISIANGTLRLGVIFQTLVASLNYRKHKVLDLKTAISISIPSVIGSICGAIISVKLEEDLLKTIIAVMLLILLIPLCIKPQKWLEGQEGLFKDKPSILQYVIFFIIGFYGGFIHIGVGIFLLSALVLVTGFDLVKANAIKVFIVLLYSPFALFIFMLSGNIDYKIGLISAIGNVTGGYFASKLSINIGSGFIRWFMIFIILLFSSKLLGFWELV